MISKRLEELARQLQNTGEVEFEYGGLRYQIFLRSDMSYEINVFNYSTNKEFDGGVYEGGTSAAIQWAISTITLNDKDVKHGSVPTTNLYWNDPDNGKCSDFVKGFWKDSTIGVVLENRSEAEVNDWELEFKFRQQSTQESKDLMSSGGFVDKQPIDLVKDGCTDAYEWAKQFTKIIKERGYKVEDIDTNWMVSWFASAITTAQDAGRYVNEFELDPIEQMQKFQIDRQLHLMKYNALNETSMLLEEIFEGFGFDTPKENREQLTNSFRQWMTTLNENGVIVYDESKTDAEGNVKWEELVDHTCDMIEISVGKLMKLRASVPLSLLEMSKEINSRKGRLIDGKFTKFKEGEEGYEPTYTADYSKCRVRYDD